MPTLTPTASPPAAGAAQPGTQFWFGNRFWKDLTVNIAVSVVAVLAVALADPVLLADPRAWAVALAPGVARTILTAALAVFARHGVVPHA